MIEYIRFVTNENFKRTRFPLNYWKIYIPILLSFAALFFLYYPVVTVDVTYFHNDDLLLLNKLAAVENFNSLINFLFNVENYKFRPIANLQWLIEYGIFGRASKAYIVYNIVLVLVVNYIFLLFFYQKSHFIVCMVLSLLLASSKFFTYSIWNITGSFESLAVILFLTMIWLVYSKSDLSKFWFFVLACLLIFTSERYLPFVVVFPIVYGYFYSSHNFLKAVLNNFKYSIIVLIIFVSLRYFLGLPILVGTQTTNVIDGFSISRFFLHFFKAYVELFGVSIGPKYLSGFEFVDWVPFSVLMDNSVYMRGLFIGFGLLVISVYYLLFRMCVGNKDIFIFNFIGFILILAASITFRVELRWLLPSYLMLLLIFSERLNFDIFDSNGSNLMRFDRALFYSFVSFSLLSNINYAIYYRRSLYFAERLHDGSFLSLFVF